LPLEGAMVDIILWCPLGSYSKLPCDNSLAAPIECKGFNVAKLLVGVSVV